MDVLSNNMISSHNNLHIFNGFWIPLILGKNKLKLI